MQIFGRDKNIFYWHNFFFFFIENGYLIVLYIYIRILCLGRLFFFYVDNSFFSWDTMCKLFFIMLSYFILVIKINNGREHTGSLRTQVIVLKLKKNMSAISFPFFLPLHLLHKFTKKERNNLKLWKDKRCIPWTCFIIYIKKVGSLKWAQC